MDHMGTKYQLVRFLKALWCCGDCRADMLYFCEYLFGFVCEARVLCVIGSTLVRVCVFHVSDADRSAQKIYIFGVYTSMYTYIAIYILRSTLHTMNLVIARLLSVQVEWGNCEIYLKINNICFRKRVARRRWIKWTE